MSPGYQVIKRLLDFMAALIGLVFAAPLMLAIGLVIKNTSSGAVFFRQERIGLNEKSFVVYKFRTMIDNAEKLGTSVTAGNDPRITTVGRFLRLTKLDELPQLINVLKGEMSLVGPRPDVREIVLKYTPEMKKIFLIRPGITSVATLHLRDEEGILARVSDPDRFYEDVLVPLKVNLGMEHVRKRSLLFDLKVLCQTVWALTVGKWLPIDEHALVTNLKKSLIGPGVFR